MDESQRLNIVYHFAKVTKINAIEYEEQPAYKFNCMALSFIVTKLKINFISICEGC